jgi:predicted CoA-binding protein
MREPEACKLPTPPDKDESAVVARLLKARRIAVVGLSPDPHRASHDVAVYLQSIGCEIVPVNPNYDEILGVRCYPSLKAIPGGVELADVFRRPEHCAEVVRDAIAAGIKGVWLQAGILSDEAEKLARDAGIDFVQDRCLKIDHMMTPRR